MRFGTLGLGALLAFVLGPGCAASSEASSGFDAAKAAAGGYATLVGLQNAIVVSEDPLVTYRPERPEDSQRVARRQALLDGLWATSQELALLHGDDDALRLYCPASAFDRLGAQTGHSSDFFMKEQRQDDGSSVVYLVGKYKGVFAVYKARYRPEARGCGYGTAHLQGDPSVESFWPMDAATLYIFNDADRDARSVDRDDAIARHDAPLLFTKSQLRRRDAQSSFNFYWQGVFDSEAAWLEPAFFACSVNEQYAQMRKRVVEDIYGNDAHTRCRERFKARPQ